MARCRGPAPADTDCNTPRSSRPWGVKTLHTPLATVTVEKPYVPMISHSLPDVLLVEPVTAMLIFLFTTNFAEVPYRNQRGMWGHVG